MKRYVIIKIRSEGNTEVFGVKTGVFQTSPGSGGTDGAELHGREFDESGVAIDRRGVR